ncbi:MAG: alpha/beta fold hydrolase, partial [Microthrixaceae bacterium]
MSTFTTADASELFRAEPDRYLDVGAGEVACRTVGRGPDVLFVHGWPVSGATFRKLLPHLVDHLTCHVVDLLGAGSSRFGADSPLSIDQHIEAVGRIPELLELRRFAVVGHDSGGLIARHALAGDDRLTAMGLLDTELPHSMSWRFRMFVANRHVPGFGSLLGWLVARPRLRRNGFVLGDAFVDRSLLDGEFEEFFLCPLAEDPLRRAAAMKVLRSFRPELVWELGELHGRIDVPVQLV